MKKETYLDKLKKSIKNDTIRKILFNKHVIQALTESTIERIAEHIVKLEEKY